MKRWNTLPPALLFPITLFAAPKVDKDVAYGSHPRNVLDVYWDSEFEDAPIVFTIHGGGFKNGDKGYCSRDMQRLYKAKGCIVVSPNYRLVKPGSNLTKDDCALDAAMAVAYIQANASKYGGDPARIFSSGSSAGGYISAQIAYKEEWDWPKEAKYKPAKLNIIGWFGDSPFLPPPTIREVTAGDPPGFIMYGGEREHWATPAKQGHQMQAALKEKKIWSKMVYIDALGHVPARRVLFSPRTRDQATFAAYDHFLDMVLHGKGEPQGGDVINVE